ncbi:hypothetical protein AB6N23_10790 [Cellulomonas sp. 179-A 9B4 NHS]|uniref:hypothetical protein n=1 Tax=Cellulomonas sp. 179-A 9B4 NHS TaxID=3142379 RepID=UPI0039A294EA
MTTDPAPAGRADEQHAQEHRTDENRTDDVRTSGAHRDGVAADDPHAATEARLHAVAAAFADVPGVVLPSAGRRHFGTATLRVHGRIAAFTPGAHLVVKLPRDRVAGLVASGAGLPFPDDRPPMREWVQVVSDDPGVWHGVVAEALAFVGG